MSTAINLVLWGLQLFALYFAIFWLVTFLNKAEHFGKEKRRQRKLKRFPLVSVIIPAYNVANTIKPTMNSAININYPKHRLELIVVNDGSTDGTRQNIEQVMKKNKDRKITLINQRNKGKAAALNAAIKIAKGEFFACMDADSFVDKETLRKMLYLFQEKGERLVIVTPAMKVDKPKSLLQRFQKFEYILAILINRLLSHLSSLYVAPGPFSLYRKETVQKLGGFDENNLTEDQEIGYRMQHNNYGVMQCHDGYVHTVAPKTARQFFRQRNRWYKGSLINIFKYKTLLFNPQYGHFGVFQVPFNLSGFIIAILAVFLFNYFFIWPLIKHIYNLSLVGFDIATYIQKISLSIDLLGVDITRTFLLAALFMLILIIFTVAFRNVDEKMRRQGVVNLVPYFLFYYLILSFVCVISILDLLVRRKQKW
jgi:cellulose synthase/poly-beta-1,6-N-acetylglucosamine synthase-like glycosyltransferase